MMSMRARRVVFEPHPAGLLDVELADRAAAIRSDLNEIAAHRLHARQISADAIDQRRCDPS